MTLGYKFISSCRTSFLEAVDGLWTLEHLLLTSEYGGIGLNSLYSQQSTNRTIQPSAATARILCKKFFLPQNWCMTKRERGREWLFLCYWDLAK